MGSNIYTPRLRESNQDIKPPSFQEFLSFSLCQQSCVLRAAERNGLQGVEKCGSGPFWLVGHIYSRCLYGQFKAREPNELPCSFPSPLRPHTTPAAFLSLLWCMTIQQEDKKVKVTFKRHSVFCFGSISPRTHLTYVFYYASNRFCTISEVLLCLQLIKLEKKKEIESNKLISLHHSVLLYYGTR